MDFGIDIVAIHPNSSADFPGEINAVRLVAARIIFLEAVSDIRGTVRQEPSNSNNIQWIPVVAIPLPWTSVR